MSRWNNKGKNNYANYNYQCDKLANNCEECDEYAEAEDRYPYSFYFNW